MTPIAEGSGADCEQWQCSLVTLSLCLLSCDYKCKDCGIWRLYD